MTIEKLCYALVTTLLVMMTGCADVQDANQSQKSQAVSGCEVDCAGGQVLTCTITPCSATATTLTCNGVITNCPPPQICTPGDVRGCCAFSGGCGCIGEQTCNSSGTAWGSCFGSTRSGTQCP